MYDSKRILEDLNRDLSGDEPHYGEDLYGDGPWPAPDEIEFDSENEE